MTEMYESYQPSRDLSEVSPDREVNFMGAHNFKLSALQQLYVVWSSAIIGEPSYYRNSESKSYLSRLYQSDDLLCPETSNDIFMLCLKNALDENFKAVLDFAVQLRTEFKMRLGPQIILVEAALNQNRKKFNEDNPMYFRQIASKVICLPTDMKSQLDHYIKINGSKAKLPGILKRCWQDFEENMSRYHVAKYKNMGKLVDLVRLSHPRSSKNELIADLVFDRNIDLEDDETTWEKLKSAGKCWRQIIEQLGNKFPHMALLRNLRNISQEVSAEEMSQVMDQLVQGVPFGKQFPFRYYTAYKQFDTNDVDIQSYMLRKKIVSVTKKPLASDPAWKWRMYRKQEAKAKKRTTDAITAAISVDSNNPEITIKIDNPIVINKIIKDGLERCMSVAIANFPSLEGSVVCLSDNSGSAWGTFQSEYGSQTVASIGNLSSLITAMSATRGGKIGLFGDRLEMYTVSKDRGIIEQLDEINKLGQTVGQSTENGIWLWFDSGFKDPNFNQNVDHLFIYSDMQAGHGGLYGTNHNDYSQFACRRNYIDVIKLIKHHRLTINPKLNVFTVQTAGYDNSLVPEVLARTAILAGWTGNEVSYAKRMIDLWDSFY